MVTKGVAPGAPVKGDQGNVALQGRFKPANCNIADESPKAPLSTTPLQIKKSGNKDSEGMKVENSAEREEKSKQGVLRVKTLGTALMNTQWRIGEREGDKQKGVA